MSFSEILSFGMYAPDNSITNDELSGIVDTSDEWITSRTGIKRRHISLGENTSDLCIKAAENALINAQISPEDIQLIIVATMSPDYSTPSTACIVQGKLGCNNAFAFDVSAACSGFIYAMCVADKFIKAGSCENALVIGAEVTSKITDWTDRGTCVLFGDGAGAAVLKSSEKKGIIAEDIHSDGRDAMKLTAMQRGVNNYFLNSDKKDNPYIYMDGRAIFNFATKKVPLTINKVLENAKLNIDDIKYIVPHQANLRIIDVVARKMDIDINKFYLNLDEFGNTSAASIPMAISSLYKEGKIKKGDKLLLTGFGGGLTWASIIIEI